MTAVAADDQKYHRSRSCSTPETNSGGRQPLVIQVPLFILAALAVPSNSSMDITVTLGNNCFDSNALINYGMSQGCWSFLEVKDFCSSLTELYACRRPNLYELKGVRSREYNVDMVLTKILARVELWTRSTPYDDGITIDEPDRRQSSIALVHLISKLRADLATSGGALTLAVTCDISMSPFSLHLFLTCLKGSD